MIAQLVKISYIGVLLFVSSYVYSQDSSKLDKFYLKALDLAWRQIDPQEMKTVSEQAKRADKRG